MHHLYVLDRTYMQESMAYSISALTADTKSELDYFGDVYTTVAILSGPAGAAPKPFAPPPPSHPVRYVAQ